MDKEREKRYLIFEKKKEKIDYMRLKIGNMKKEKVSEIEEEMGMNVEKKKDRKDIWFVKKGKY